MTILFIFIGLSIINVVFSTIRSIVLVNGNKYIASILSAGYFAFYNIMLIYTVADFPIWEKCLITFIINLVCVFAVKYVEEKRAKEKLWKIEFSIDKDLTENFIEALKKFELSFNVVETSYQYNIVNVYCATKKESGFCREIANRFNVKYFASETKI